MKKKEEFYAIKKFPPHFGRSFLKETGGSDNVRPCFYKSVKSATRAMEKLQKEHANYPEEAVISIVKYRMVE